MSNKLTTDELKQIHDEILPAAEHYNRTGSLQGVRVPRISILQAIHQRAYGYKFDQGCPSCIGDAIRLLGNIYREQAIQEAPAQTYIEGFPAIQVPENKTEVVKSIIAAYHKGIQDAKTGEAIKQVMDDTAKLIGEIIPEQAENIQRAMDHQWLLMVAKVQSKEPASEHTEEYTGPNSEVPEIKTGLIGGIANTVRGMFGRFVSPRAIEQKPETQSSGLHGDLQPGETDPE